jgi:hypothetical protein
MDQSLPVSVSYGSLERLVHIRALLEEGARQAAGASPFSRHAAVVLLDGACELAIATGLSALGLQVERSFPKNLDNLVRKLGDSWQAPGVDGVRQLHQARNGTQHHGVFVDGSQLNAWVADTYLFAGGVVEAVFQQDLRLVTLAQGIRDSGIREEFVKAEGALSSSPPSAHAAITHALSAFGRAREAWRKSHGWDRTQISLRYDGRDGLVPSWVPGAIDQLRDTFEVSTFAHDMGEYVWLREVYSLLKSDAPLDEADARRVLAFVFGWIIRWEAFSGSYDPDRLAEWRRSIRPARTGRDNPTIANWFEAIDIPVPLTDGELPRPMSFSLRFRFTDAPGDEFEHWFNALRWALHTPPDNVARVEVEQDGFVTFHNVAENYALTDLIEYLADALERASEETTAHYQKELERDSVAKDLVSAYLDALDHIAVLGVQLVTDVERQEDIKSSNAPDFRFRAVLSPAPPGDSRAVRLEKHLSDAASNLSAERPGRWVWDGAIHFTSDLTPDELARIVEAAAEMWETDLLRFEAIQAQREDARSAFEASVKSALSEHTLKRTRE